MAFVAVSLLSIRFECPFSKKYSIKVVMENVQGTRKGLRRVREIVVRHVVESGLRQIFPARIGV